MTKQDTAEQMSKNSASRLQQSRLIPLRGDPMTGDRYYCPDFAKREWDNMWTKVWHVGGRADELEEPGDYIVHNFRRESVIMVRQDDGSVRAFYNTCLHRGNRLVWNMSGGVNGALTCAYHGWKWGLNGVLEDAQDREFFPQGDPCGKLKLVEVKCEQWGGFIWYSMNPDARPLLDYLDPIPDLLKNRDMENLVRVVWRQVKVNTNWKFSADNFNESYHLPAVHPQMQEYIDEDYKNTIFEMYPNGHNRMLEQGQPSLRSRRPNEVEPIWDAMLREWDLDPADFAGRAREGRAALIDAKRRLGRTRGYHYLDKLSDDELVDPFHHTLFPNVTITGAPDGVHFFRTEPHPTDPEWCTFDYWFLAPRLEGVKEIPTVSGMRPIEPAEIEILEFGRDQVGDFVDQDLSVAVAQQQGFHSQAYKDAYLNGQEARVRRFHEVLNDYLEGRRTN